MMTPKEWALMSVEKEIKVLEAMKYRIAGNAEAKILEVMVGYEVTPQDAPIVWERVIGRLYGIRDEITNRMELVPLVDPMTKLQVNGAYGRKD